MASTDPPILRRLTSQLRSKGKDPGAARAIAISALRKSGNLEKSGISATPKGEKRGTMTPGERAKDRASKASGHPASAFVYHVKTNRATKR